MDDLLSEFAKLYQNYVSFSDLEEFKATHEIPPTHNFKLYKYLHKREKLNRKFLKQAKKHHYKMGDYELDTCQTVAVHVCEDATLILAPAGSGKTATLLAKVDYLITHQNIPPKNILIIAFTNKVVEELKERLHNDQVEIRTFHSLGNKIVKTKKEKYTLITEETAARLIHDIILSELKNNKTFHARFSELMSGPRSVLPTFIITPPKYTPESFEELMISAINLQKSERINLKELKSRLEHDPEALQLFTLYRPIYLAYEKHLRAHHLYDFADMLNISTDHVNKMPDNSFNYQYILVDEAQDLSRSKCDLLKAILDKCHKVKLFAVGDDWQSIYRFAGSNLKVLDDFEQTFGLTTHRGIIEFTYRFGQPTARISNKFIRKNKFQSKKRVIPAQKKYTPIEHKLYNKVKHAPPDYEPVDEILHALFQEFGPKLFEQNLQIISRYNRDIFRLVDAKTKTFGRARYQTRTATLEWTLKTGEILQIPYCTIHKAKGITRDIVIVINMNDEETGMPARRDDNPLLGPMLAKIDDYPFAEERRLFYVAITRAKNRTILVANYKHPSPFLLELNPNLKEDEKS